MTAWRPVWLVAAREMRERSRSRGFRVSVVVMLLLVVGVIVVPTVFDSGSKVRNVGVTGKVPDELSTLLRAQGAAINAEVRIRRYDDLASAETAVRDGKVDVLVVDGRRLEWRRREDASLKAAVSGAIQLVALSERAAAVGLTPNALTALITPAPIESVDLGSTPGRSPDDETAALIMGVLLLLAITTYGNLVLSGVVEEKTSRVVEVLLARIPARSLLAGKVTGIGLLGLAQFAVTAAGALIATATVRSFDIPAVRGTVIAWVVVWFVLGYALYAMLYGALGSLASRPEDAQSVSGPVTVVLVAAYWVSVAAMGRPDSGFARVVSLVPPTAPFAMPARIAMSNVAWWETMLAVALALAAIAGLVQFAGRVYAGAVLHTGPTLKLRDVWRDTPPAGAAGKTDVRRHVPRWCSVNPHRPARH